MTPTYLARGIAQSFQQTSCWLVIHSSTTSAQKFNLPETRVTAIPEKHALSSAHEDKSGDAWGAPTLELAAKHLGHGLRTSLGIYRIHAVPRAPET